MSEDDDEKKYLNNVAFLLLTMHGYKIAHQLVDATIILFMETGEEKPLTRAQGIKRELIRLQAQLN